MNWPFWGAFAAGILVGIAATLIIVGLCLSPAKADLENEVIIYKELYKALAKKVDEARRILNEPITKKPVA